jgi:hypothetical protein
VKRNAIYSSQFNYTIISTLCNKINPRAISWPLPHQNDCDMKYSINYSNVKIIFMF